MVQTERKMAVGYKVTYLIVKWCSNRDATQNATDANYENKWKLEKKEETNSCYNGRVPNLQGALVARQLVFIPAAVFANSIEFNGCIVFDPCWLLYVQVCWCECSGKKRKENLSGKFILWFAGKLKTNLMLLPSLSVCRWIYQLFFDPTVRSWLHLSAGVLCGSARSFSPVKKLRDALLSATCL